jgi:hypothetical protein
MRRILKIKWYRKITAERDMNISNYNLGTKKLAENKKFRIVEILSQREVVYRQKVTNSIYAVAGASSAAGIIATLSSAIPMTLRPLSTYKVVPVIARDRGESMKAAVAPTSSE